MNHPNCRSHVILMDHITNPWGWPCIYGLGDEAARHPVDPDHDMIWFVPADDWVVVWDERLQLEYGTRRINDMRVCSRCGGRAYGHPWSDCREYAP